MLCFVFFLPAQSEKTVPSLLVLKDEDEMIQSLRRVNRHFNLDLFFRIAQEAFRLLFCWPC